MDKPQPFNLSQYLLNRLYELGSKHLFGVCGDVVLGFMEQVVHGPVKQISCCNELNAGYAADGYARLHGIGTVVTTFNVGPLSASNAIGGAFAEYVPVVMVVGAPERQHALASRMLHHTLGPDYSIVREMYRKITVACEYLDNSATAPQQIDTALSKCLYYKRPIYLELPADMVMEKCPQPKQFTFINKASDPETLHEAINESVNLISAAKHPIIVLGLEVIRHELQENVKKLVEKTGFAFCAFPTAKTALSEDHPQFIGIYQGSWSRPYVKEMVEKSDCIIMLGGFFIDSDTGGFTAHLDQTKLIQANFEETNIKHHHYSNVLLKDYLDQLTAKLSSGKVSKDLICAEKALRNEMQCTPDTNAKITVKHFFKRIDSFLKPDDVVVVDVGDCLYSTSGLLFPKNTTYISQAFYNSIGYSVGSALGAATSQKRRTILFVGDGSFQIGAQEISTIIRYELPLIVFILNNDGYGIERAIHDGPYNDLAAWKYHLLPQAFGGDPGILVQTEGELEKALQKADNANKLVFIEIKVDRFDFGDILRLAGAAMAESSKNSYAT